MSEFMRRLRENFEALYRLHFKPNGDHSLEWLDHPLDLDGDEPRYLMSHPDLYFQFYQTGFTDALTEKSKRIAELEASLADAVEAQQIIGLKLAHAEAESARLRVDAGRWRYREKLLNEGGQIWQTKGAVTIRDFKRDIIARGHSEAEAIDAAMQGHSSTALCGPTADAAPSCEHPS